MFYDKRAEIRTQQKESDGMGGWLDSESSVKVGEISVVTAPVSAEITLKEYGLISTTSMKLFTEDDVPEEDVFIKFEGSNYRILQNLDYGSEKGLLLERM